MWTKWRAKFAAETIEILLNLPPPKKSHRKQKPHKPLISANIHLLREKITFQNSAEITSSISDKKTPVLASGEGML